MKKLASYAVVAMIFGGTVVSCQSNYPTLDSANPFANEWIAQKGMPPFDKIDVTHILPALKIGISQVNYEIDQIIKQSEYPTYENTILSLNKTGELLEKVSIVYGALASSEMSNELRGIQPEVVSLFSEHESNVSLNVELFKRIKIVYDGKSEIKEYTPEQIRLIEKTYDEFAMSGANLPEINKTKIRKIDAELSELSMKFGNYVMNENNNFKMVIENKSDLSGLSESSISAAATEAIKQGLDGKWVFTLKKPSYIPFMQYAKNRELRKIMFEGYSNVGNNINSDNTKDIVKQIVKLRLEKAQLFDCKTFAEYNLKNSVAKTPEAVFEFIEKLWIPVVKRAKEEVNDMQRIMRVDDGITDSLKSWDWFYYAEKVRAAKYNLNENDMKPYFEVNRVRDGAHMVANKLFGMTFVEVNDAVKINKETQVFNVYDENGDFLSVLTWDFFPRASKRGGAWCSSLKKQKYIDGERVAPIVTITCNFTPAIGDTPALITPDEVTTLFHEFGHAIQGMLTDIKEPGLARNPRDFVEFPSQLLEYWAFEPEVLSFYAKHYRTGKAIPLSLIDKMEKSSAFNQGFVNGENLSASYLDMAYHSISDHNEIINMNVMEFEKKILDEIGIMNEFIPRYRTTYFNHIFSGGYAAGYYSYKWSEVMSADGFAAFSETGDIFNKEVATRLMNLVLSKGGSEDEKSMYVKWRGVDADEKYLMNSLGLN